MLRYEEVKIKFKMPMVGWGPEQSDLAKDVPVTVGGVGLDDL